VSTKPERSGPSDRSVRQRRKNRDRTDRDNGPEPSDSPDGRRKDRGGEPREALLRRMARAAFAGRTDELLGLVLVLGGLLTGLSVYLGKAGIVGRLIDSGAGWTIGTTKVGLPVAMVAVGLAMFRERIEFDEMTRRLPVGAFMALFSVTGLLHLGRGRPGISDGADGLGAGGGLLGLAVGGGLDAAIDTIGAVLILIGTGLVGLAVITRVSASQAARGVVVVARRVGRALLAGLVPLGRALRNWVQNLLSAPGSDDPQVVVHHESPAPQPVPEAASEPVSAAEPDGHAPEPEPVTKKRRHRTEVAAGSGEQLTIELGAAVDGSTWRLPPLSILSRSETHDIDAKAIEERGYRLQEALSAHGVETRLIDMTVGPTVTRYALQLGDGVKVARVTSLNKDIAYALAAADVRILAPIPGQQAIGIEVPNEEREVVALGDILSSTAAAKAQHPLEAGIGRDIDGKPVLLNLSTMPHLLIAGATGAGKSSCINSLVTSVLMRSSPEQVRLILIDPKRVEMGQYEGVPHLLTAPVTDPKKAANSLHWAVREMERRYGLLSDCGFRDIAGYNAAHDRGELQAPLGVTDDDGEPMAYQRLPFILIVVDELSDLMMVAARDVEDSICRLAQMARAVGIHLVVATQRPSVNVITGVIKANIPARLAFEVSSLADSRVILDQPGAERLVGKGDMLLLGPSSNTPQRIQGAWVNESEVRQVVSAWTRQVDDILTAGDDDSPVTAEVPVLDSPTGSITDDSHRSPTGGSGDDDDLFEQARELVVSSQLGSTSMLQRKLRVGFARAGRLMDQLEEAGVVGPSTGSKAREVLLASEDLENLNEQGL